MKQSISSRAGIVFIAAAISTGVAGWSVWQLLETRLATELAILDKDELLQLRDEVRALTETQESANLKILPAEELTSTVMSAIQGIQPLAGQRTSIDIGRENRVAKLDFIRRKTQIEVETLTLRECKELLNTLRARLPSAAFAEIALRAGAASRVSTPETWTLELSLEEIRYAPAATKD